MLYYVTDFSTSTSPARHTLSHIASNSSLERYKPAFLVMNREQPHRTTSPPIEFRQRLESHLSQRPNREDLLSHNIIKSAIAFN
jgi:hypothetical protein